MTALQQDTVPNMPARGGVTGWVDRRDQALRVLTQLAGLSVADIADLTAGDATVVDGTASVTTPTGTITIDPVPDDVFCGACVLARWLHTLDMTITYPDRWVVSAVIARAAPLVKHPPFACCSTATIAPATRNAPLFPAVDQWGLLPIATPTRTIAVDSPRRTPDPV